jgi:RNA-directed DNA polymerase
MIQNLPAFMHDALGLNEAQLQRLIARSPYTYKIYTIPKKSGGVRTIAQPARETKFIQHWLIENIFCKLPVHDCASAYKIGASIKANAAAHSQNSYISKFDFSAFFSSITQVDLISHFNRHFKDAVSIGDITNIARLACIRPKDGSGLCLSIGAPSSPILSNSIMFEFDCIVHQWCKSRGLTYTRYADDLTFSTNTKDICSEIEPLLRIVLSQLVYPNLRLNDNKTIHLSKKNQRRITGVIINNEGELSTGRNRKRTISALIHKFTINALTANEIYKLQGLLGFAKDIEPGFIVSMKRKYGPEVINAIFLVRKPH